MCGRAGLGVADHHHVGRHGVQVAGGVEQRLALDGRRRRARDVDRVGRQPLGRDLERRAGAGRGLEEQVDDRLAPQGRHLLDRPLGDLEEALAEVEDGASAPSARERLDAQQVAVREAVRHVATPLAQHHPVRLAALGQHHPHRLGRRVVCTRDADDSRAGWAARAGRGRPAPPAAPPAAGRSRPARPWPPAPCARCRARRRPARPCAPRSLLGQLGGADLGLGQAQEDVVAVKRDVDRAQGRAGARPPRPGSRTMPLGQERAAGADADEVERLARPYALDDLEGHPAQHAGDARRVEQLAPLDEVVVGRRRLVASQVVPHVEIRSASPRRYPRPAPPPTRPGCRARLRTGTRARPGCRRRAPEPPRNRSAARPRARRGAGPASSSPCHRRGGTRRSRAPGWRQSTGAASSRAAATSRPPARDRRRCRATAPRRGHRPRPRPARRSRRGCASSSSGDRGHPSSPRSPRPRPSWRPGSRSGPAPAAAAPRPSAAPRCRAARRPRRDRRARVLVGGRNRADPARRGGRGRAGRAEVSGEKRPGSRGAAACGVTGGAGAGGGARRKGRRPRRRLGHRRRAAGPGGGAARSAAASAAGSPSRRPPTMPDPSRRRGSGGGRRQMRVAADRPVRNGTSAAGAGIAVVEVHPS